MRTPNISSQSSSVSSNQVVNASLSPQAQEMITKRVRFADYLPASVWPMCRQGFHDGMIADSDMAKNTHIKSVEEKVIAGARTLELTPNSYDGSDKVILYVHGGALTLGAPDCQMQIPAPLADRTGRKVIAVDYPLAPYATKDDPHPAHTAVFEVYKELLKTHESSEITFLGDSAGGGIAFGVALMARDQNLPLPGAIVAYEPWVDMEQQGATYSNQERINQTVVLTPETLKSARDAAFGEQTTYSKYVSPVNDDFHGFKNVAVAIYTAGRDLLKEEGETLADKIKENADKTQYICWPGLWHGFQEHYGMPEAEGCADKAADFLKAHT